MGWINDFLSIHFVRIDLQKVICLSVLFQQTEKGVCPSQPWAHLRGLWWLSFVMPPRGVFKNKIMRETFNHRGRFCGVKPAFLNPRLLTPVAGRFSVVEAVSCVVECLATPTQMPGATFLVITRKSPDIVRFPRNPQGKNHFWLKTIELNKQQKKTYWSALSWKTHS